eukprot:TRINITY_DN52413_c0_g1_i1.p1 TRINITY_DN52413_c0_g1~~TRINITY_DN52413_c0_g1_i1.p1  ORF type:complete len:316 (-),score=33.68 TRINITY_DN52413_c0_g1_i1:165-1067(-)
MEGARSLEAGLTPRRAHGLGWHDRQLGDTACVNNGQRDECGGCCCCCLPRSITSRVVLETTSGDEVPPAIASACRAPSTSSRRPRLDYNAVLFLVTTLGNYGWLLFKLEASILAFCGLSSCLRIVKRLLKINVPVPEVAIAAFVLTIFAAWLLCTRCPEDDDADLALLGETGAQAWSARGEPTRQPHLSRGFQCGKAARLPPPTSSSFVVANGLSLDAAEVARSKQRESGDSAALPNTCRSGGSDTSPGGDAKIRGRGSPLTGDSSVSTFASLASDSSAADGLESSRSSARSSGLCSATS